MKILAVLIAVGVLISIGISAWTLLELRSFEKDLYVRVQEISSSVEGIKKLSGSWPAARRPSPPRSRKVKVRVDDDPIKGDPSAPVTIIEFSDYQCPFCKAFYDRVLPSLDKEYISTGKVRLVFRDFPLDFHKNAFPAAIAANCSGEGGKYWEMHNFLFENPGKLDSSSMIAAAREFGLNREKFEKCLNDKKNEAEIEKDLRDGGLYGVRGTPSFFIGKTSRNNDAMTGLYLSGAQPFQVFKTEIEKLLADK